MSHPAAKMAIAAAATDAARQSGTDQIDRRALDARAKAEALTASTGCGGLQAAHVAVPVEREHGGSELDKLVVVFTPRSEVGLDVSGFAAIESAEHVRGQQFADLFAVHRNASPRTDSVSFVMANLSRLLTVPSGNPSRSAISRRLKSPK